MKLFACLLAFACGNNSLTMFTGHIDQEHIIFPAFQHAMEYNVDGAVTYWNDLKSQKSGYIKPLYVNGHNNTCRHFEIAYFYPDKKPSYHYGIGCRRDTVWRVQ